MHSRRTTRTSMPPASKLAGGIFIFCERIPHARASRHQSVEKSQRFDAVCTSTRAHFFTHRGGDFFWRRAYARTQKSAGEFVRSARVWEPACAPRADRKSSRRMSAAMAAYDTAGDAVRRELPPRPSVETRTRVHRRSAARAVWRTPAAPGRRSYRACSDAAAAYFCSLRAPRLTRQSASKFVVE